MAARGRARARCLSLLLAAAMPVWGAWGRPSAVTQLAKTSSFEKQPRFLLKLMRKLGADVIHAARLQSLAPPRFSLRQRLAHCAGVASAWCTARQKRRPASRCRRATRAGGSPVSRVRALADASMLTPAPHTLSHTAAAAAAAAHSQDGLYVHQQGAEPRSEEVLLRVSLCGGVRLRRVLHSTVGQTRTG